MMKKIITLLIIGMVLIALFFIKETYFSWGNVKVVVQNYTLSSQTIWLTPKESFIFDIPKGKEMNIKYPLENTEIGLVLTYINPEGKEETILLSEYVEKSYQGKVTVKMTQQEPNGVIKFEIKDRIRL
jgi:hypothetical protein